MGKLAITHEVEGPFDLVCEKLTEAIKAVGFGILTRIDFDQKIREKLNQNINRCVIFGACNPQLALEAYRQSSDVALLIPCNVVVTDIAHGKVRIEAMRPTMMLDFLKEVKRSETIVAAERELEGAIRRL